MVLIPPVASRMFSVSLSYGDNLRLYLLPAIYIFALYLTWRLDKVTFDLFIITIGVGFFSVLLLLPPSPGWFLWSLPFIVFYQLKSRGDYLFIIIPYFFFSFIISMSPAPPYLFSLFHLLLPLNYLSPFRPIISISYLSTSNRFSCMLSNVLLWNRSCTYYRRGRRPLIVGIVGDLGFESDFYLLACVLYWVLKISLELDVMTI